MTTQESAPPAPQIVPSLIGVVVCAALMMGFIAAAGHFSPPWARPGSFGWTTTSKVLMAFGWICAIMAALSLGALGSALWAKITGKK